ncbi:hypothetical protein B0H19DRAFT_1160361 [Mycena capillaripes]|nr:hypothetical protein B0H19DRAFT_1160361 [Mycena capillaripes]
METLTPLAQEIWDEILDYLNTGRDLKSSALVCRSFVSRAQMHLFHSIRLERPTTPETRSAGRLAELLSRSPHLIYHIRNLYIGFCDVETLIAMVQISWSGLLSISFARLYCKPREDEQRTQLIDLTSTLASIPTLRNVYFHSSLWEADALCAVLGGCNIEVSRMGFYGAFIGAPVLYPTSGTKPRMPQSTQPRPAIASIDVFAVQTIPYFLLDALDLSRLAHVKFGRYATSGIDVLLHHCRHTIQSLDFDGSVGEKVLDLASFPALSHVTLVGVGRGVQEVLERSGASNVRTICHRITSIDVQSGLLQGLESVVLSANLPALRQVEMHIIMLRGSASFSNAEWRSHINMAMPQLEGRGMLVMRFEASG